MMQRNRSNPGTGESACLWFLETGSFDDPAVAHPWLARLEQHERNRYSIYRTAAARREYLGTRALARTALAHYTGQPAGQLRFGTDSLGRPALISPPIPRLFFSLSNTKKLAVGLFAFDRNVGVDVEFVTPVDAVEIAESFFSAPEVAELALLDEASRQSRFYELWTLREAYLKARGVGLALPLAQLVFRPTLPGSVQAEFGPAIRDDPAHWQFGLTWLTADHLAATCVRRASSAKPVRIVQVDALAMAAATTQALPA